MRLLRSRLLFGFAASLLFLTAISISVSRAAPGDLDDDGVPDDVDNCIERVNPGQVDVDQDGFGNRCDGDFDNDGAAGVGDIGLYLAVWGTQCSSPDYNPLMDLDSDCVIGIADYGMLIGLFGESGYIDNQSTGKAAGEGNPISGLACASSEATEPCEALPALVAVPPAEVIAG